MILYIMAIKDKATKVFMTPGYAHNIQMAMRDFADSLNNEQSPMNKHPHDFELYIVGLYDDNTGEIAADKPECIMTGTEAYTGPERPATIYHETPADKFAHLQGLFPSKRH